MNQLYDDLTYAERKQRRREYFEKHVKGWKQRNCGACNGSGRYDNTGSPPCGGCDGTGKELYKPTQEKSCQEQASEAQMTTNTVTVTTSPLP